MRELADAARIERFMRELGRAVDVREMIERGLVNPAEALVQFEAIEPELYRFPAIDPTSFRKAVHRLFGR